MTYDEPDLYEPDLQMLLTRIKYVPMTSPISRLKSNQIEGSSSIPYDVTNVDATKFCQCDVSTMTLMITPSCR